MQIGVDEAGKGPVLGSMFAAAVRAPPAAIPDGVRDSKELTPQRRDELARALREEDRVAIGLAEIVPARIDDPETDMNTLTVVAQAEALGAVAVDGDEAFLDAGDTNAVRFERRVGERVDVEIDLRGEHGADAAYPVVAAASVIAKVERDAHVADLAAEYGDIGSGYPGDRTTRAFLEAYVDEHERLPDCARASWKTSQEALAASEQVELGEFRPDQSTLGEY